LFAIVSGGVAVGAVVNSSVLGIAILWLILYGTGFLLSLMPPPFPSPDRTLAMIPQVLRGTYDTQVLWQLLLGSFVISVVPVLFGMFIFARKDV